MDVERVAYLCQRLQINPTELAILIVFYVKDQANLYRMAYEIPFYPEEPDRKGISKKIFDKLKDQGFLKPNPNYVQNVDPLVEAYDVNVPVLDELFMDSKQATDELFFSYPKSMVMNTGEEILTRNISIEDLHSLYSNIIGYSSKIPSRKYKTSKGVSFEKKVMPEINLKLVDSQMHKKVMVGLENYLKKVKEGTMHPMGLKKFVESQMWDSLSTMSSDMKETASQTKMDFTEGFD